MASFVDALHGDSKQKWTLKSKLTLSFNICHIALQTSLSSMCDGNNGLTRVKDESRKEMF